MSKHTPGPWVWNDCDGSLISTSRMMNWPPDEPWGDADNPVEWLIEYGTPWFCPDNGSRFARDSFQERSIELHDEMVANARLIAAAPDLLAALKRIANGGGIYGAQAYEYKQIARAAIANAESGQ